MGRDLLCVTENADAIPTLTPDQAKLMALDGLLQHITARGKEYDSVSRTLPPSLQSPRTPFAAAVIAISFPFGHRSWGRKSWLPVRHQARRHAVHCEMHGDRLSLAGTAVLYSIADLYVEEEKN